MKKLTITIFVLLLLCAGGYYGYSYYKKESSPLNKATKAEQGGQLQNAYNYYLEALSYITPLMQLPDLNKSKVVDPKIWKSDLARYNSWLLDTSKKPANFTQVYQKVQELGTKYSNSENKIVNVITTPISDSIFKSNWKNTFYASTAPWDISHNELAQEAYSRNGSFLQLSADKGFTYNVSVINMSSGIQTSYVVFSEGSTTALLFPGEYIIICKSTVDFSKGEIWVSPPTITPFTIPAQSSFIKGMLITKVSRSKT